MRGIDAKTGNSSPGKGYVNEYTPSLYLYNKYREGYFNDFCIRYNNFSLKKARDFVTMARKL